MGIIFMRNLRLDDLMRSGRHSAGATEIVIPLFEAFTSEIVDSSQQSRKKLKRGVDTRANEIYLGARKRGPPNLRPSAGRLHRFMGSRASGAHRRSFLGSSPDHYRSREGTSRYMERAWA
ncbi:hypothetical protein ACHAQJ_008316 [Trichoderma viride]